MLFDDVWERKELSKRDRSLITVAALIALNRPDQLRFHLGKAVENGVRKEELIETITHLAFYSGWPNAMTAVLLAKEIFEGKLAIMTQRRPLHASLVRIALVTGANRGIGFEVCRRLSEKDFVVLLTARDAAKAQKAARKLANVGTVEALVLDVGDASSIKKAANEVARRYGYLDVLVNNAGINYDT